MKRSHAMTYGLLAAGILAAATLTSCGSSEAKANETAYRQIGINDIQKGQYSQAVDAFNKALKESMGNVDAQELDISYYKAQAQIQAGDTKGALKTYKDLISYDKDNGKVYYLRGTLYLTLSKQKEAKKDFSEAIKTDKKEYDLYFQIYSDLSKAGLSDDANAYLTKASNLSGKNANDYAMRGKAFLLLQKYDKAKAQLEKAMKMGSDQAEVYMAQVYQAKNDNVNAKKLYETYVKKNSKDANALGSLGIMLLQQGDYDNAVKYLKMALALGDVNDKQELMKNQILAYEYKHDFANAKTLMQSYVQLYPNDADAVRENQFLQTR